MIVRITRIVVRTFLGILIFFIILLLVFDRLVQFRMDNKDLTAWFRLRHVEPHIGYFEAAGRKVRYVRTGDSSGATILFIHGAPSSMSYWRNYLTDSILLTRATMYAADRPGYGYSGLADPLPEIAAQAVNGRVMDVFNRFFDLIAFDTNQFHQTGGFEALNGIQMIFDPCK